MSNWAFVTDHAFNAPRMLYGQEVIDGYKRQLRDVTTENSLLREEIAKLKTAAKKPPPPSPPKSAKRAATEDPDRVYLK